MHVDYVNAHATSTPVGDEIEARAIQTALSLINSNTATTNGPRRTYVSSTKGATGHLLGAAGAIEAAFTIQSLVEQTIIPTLNLDSVVDITDGNTAVVDPKKLELIFAQGKEAFTCPGDMELNIAMSNSFGFGGTNSSLTFRRIRS